jgi:chromate transporter
LLLLKYFLVIGKLNINTSYNEWLSLPKIIIIKIKTVTFSKKLYLPKNHTRKSVNQKGRALKMIQINIFLAFFRVGILGYGGGPSSIPLVHKEVVDRYKWLKPDEFSDVLALGNALPGPINTKLAGYIGYRVGGITGMISGLIAMILPSALLMILLLTVLNAYKDKPWVSGMASAVVPVVAVMLATLTWEFVKRATKSKLGRGGTILLLIVSVVVLQVIHIHPAILIFALLIGALFKKSSAQVGANEREPDK